MSRDHPTPSISGMGPKRSKTQREADLAEIARLDRRGWTQTEIAKKLKLSQGMISGELKKLRKRYAESQMVHTQAKVGRRVAILEDVIREAYEAFEKSQQDAQKRVVEEYEQEGQEGQPGTKSTKEVTTIEGRIAANEFLLTILKAVRDGAEMEGLIQRGTNLQANAIAAVPIQWDKLYGRPPVDTFDPIEARIAAVADEQENGESE